MIVFWLIFGKILAENSISYSELPLTVTVTTPDFLDGILAEKRKMSENKISD